MCLTTRVIYEYKNLNFGKRLSSFKYILFLCLSIHRVKPNTLGIKINLCEIQSDLVYPNSLVTIKMCSDSETRRLKNHRLTRSDCQEKARKTIAILIFVCTTLFVR